MVELIKKYSTLLIIEIVLSRILAGIILIVFPNLLTSELPDGGTSTLGGGYLSSGFEYLINIGFMILLAKDMKTENTKSTAILIMTFFSAFIGVLFFLLNVANNRLNNIKE